MESLAFEHLTFTYPGAEYPALADVTLNIEKGGFVTVFGPSGCGKTTLLRHMKTTLTPCGTAKGGVMLDGVAISKLSPAMQSGAIGFVSQSPDSQLVTDRVWHELAFGLESLGEKTPVIRRRVAEIAEFFGMEDWLYKNPAELSGGQKQLLNLAGVMVMQPAVLVLDEPASQLDPIAAGDFINVLGRINRELGTTVIISEHRLEDVLPISTMAVAMDGGRIIAQGTPLEVGEILRHKRPEIFLSMPSPMRIWSAVPNTLPCPITARDGADWLKKYSRNHTLNPTEREPEKQFSGTPSAQLRQVWFRYEKNAPDVLKGLSINAYPGELLALMGGNGAGKTTALSLLAGLEKPYRGKVTVDGRTALLPQNPQTLFMKKTVKEDLKEVLRAGEIDPTQWDERISGTSRLCGIEGVLDRHPYDLSGGEQERAALAKVLLTRPDVLLLDEPTKGLDSGFKTALGDILTDLTEQGICVIMVSHDVEFCASYAHRCCLVFDGAVTAEDGAASFFAGNYFYTTCSARMAREVLPGAVTAEDVILACGGDIPKSRPPRGNCAGEKPQVKSPQPVLSDSSLPQWRKIAAFIFAAAAGYFAFKVLRQSDISALLSAGGLSRGAFNADTVWLMVAVLGLILSLSRKKGRVPIPAGEKRALSAQAKAALLADVLLIPLTIFVGVFYLGDRKYYFISLLVLLETMALFFIPFEGRRPQPRELVITAVLCALAVAGRAAFFMLPSFKPVLALVIISGVAFGGETGFLVGSVTMLTSNILFGQGPWSPWQMFAMGMAGLLAGVLSRHRLLGRSPGTLCAFGVAAALLIYGPVMNLATVVIWQGNVTWKLLWAALAAGLPFDLVHAVATAAFLWLAANPMLQKLERVKIKYGLMNNG